VIAGAAFTAGSAFAQYDRLQKGWWIVIGGPGHACTDTTASASQIAAAVVPNVNASFPAATPATLPPTAPQSTRGITFTDKSGYPTTINGGGATITISHAEPATGGHWSGSIEVPAQNSGKTHAFKGIFTAVVCPPTNG
jgi:hypothetical protein